MIIIGSMKEKRIITIIFILTVISITLAVTGFSHKTKTDHEILEKMEKGFYLLGDTNVTLDYGTEYKEEGFIASIEDNMSVKNIKIENNVDSTKLGEYTINYTIFYKNVSKTLTRKVKIVDKTAPIIDVDCKSKIYVTLKGKKPTCKYTAYDNYDTTVNVKVDSNVDTSKKGDYKITYTAVDSSNNEASKTINVYVRKKKELNYIMIYIKKQRLYYYKNKELVFTTPVTTGRYNATHTGNFKIKNKIRNTTLKGKDYESKVQYWMGYSGNDFGIHDASWRSRFGTSDYYYVGSHGCVNVPTKKMKQLYNMVEVGTPVYIRK